MEPTVQSIILKNLLYNEEFTRKVIPFLKMEYFEGSYRSIFNLIVKFVSKYNKLPTAESLMIDFQNDETISSHEAESMLPILQDISEYTTPSENKWLIETTEKWCQDRAIYLAIMESINIIDGKHKTLTKNSLPHLLSEALTVSFDNNIGHDYVKDSSKRYNFYHAEESKIPFDLDLFNTITKGGLPSKTLNIVLAGCVHPQTKVDIQFRKSSLETFIQKEICIAEVQTLLENGYFVEVDSPDGYVPVNFFIHKGIYQEFVLELENSNERIHCNGDHLFETKEGWISASELLEIDEMDFLTKDGLQRGSVSTTGKFIPIVDINVQSKTHRYYTSGVSSHNTGVGKSLFMCHMAASILLQGKNVLYITMEMSEERIAERIDSNLMNLPLDQIESLSKKEFETRLSKIVSKNIGRLIIKEYPTSTAHTGHFRALLNELRMKKDFSPDIIFIDYMNICTSSRIKSLGGSVNSYSFIKSIAEEIRGLAVEFNVPIVSATQTTRSGFCLDPNSKVISFEGEKLLKEVKVGDKLLSIGGWNTVNHIFPERLKKPFRILTSLGNEIICSEDHKFPIFGDSIKEKSIRSGLSVGESFISKNNSNHTFKVDPIVLIEELSDEKLLIDIELDGDHLFFANNILTHNSNTDVGLEDTSECIFVDEEVILRDGTIIPIKEIRFGDQIQSNDGYKTVLQVHHIKPKECVKITLKSGKQIRVSKDHVFPTNRGRNSIRSGLKVGDKLSTIDSKKR